MPLTPFQLPAFGGLNVLDDPQEAGLTAVDMMNIVLRPGRIYRRNAYDKFTSAAMGARPQMVATAQGYVFVATIGTTNNLRAYQAAFAGTAVSANASTGDAGNVVTLASIGTSTNNYVYVGASVNKVYRINMAAPTAFTDVTTTVGASTPFGAGSLLALMPTDNRMVMAPESGKQGYVAFSDPGAPETFGSNNFVQLGPNDGSSTAAIVNWRELVFVFHTDKFYVFYGNSTDSTGQPVFNYRPVATAAGGVGLPGLVCVGRDGVYFANDKGVWLTTGGPPTKVSDAIDPLFGEQFSDPESLSTLPYTGGSFSPRSIAYCDEGLYVAGTDGVDKTFAYDLRLKQWTVFNLPTWNVAAVDSNPPLTLAGNIDPRLYFSYENGTNDLGVYDPSSVGFPGSNLDGGSTTVTAFYRTGQLDFGTPMSEKAVREWIYDGAGTWSVGVSTNDDYATPATASVVLGSASGLGSQLGNKRDRRGVFGRNFAVYMSTTSLGAQINRVTANVRSQASPGEKGTTT